MSFWEPSKEELDAKEAWYSHYWSCRLCIGNHSQLAKPPVHPCYDGYHLREKYNNTIGK